MAKCVLRRPSPVARAFICAAKASALPAIRIASASAASLPERSIIPYKSARSVTVSPAFKYMDDPSTPTACAGTLNSSSRWPYSHTSSPVMILVVLAMRLFSSAFFSYSTRPLCASSSTAHFAESEGAFAACTGAADGSSSAASSAAAQIRSFFNSITRTIVCSGCGLLCVRPQNLPSPPCVTPQSSGACQ